MAFHLLFIFSFFCFTLSPISFPIPAAAVTEAVAAAASSSSSSSSLSSGFLANASNIPDHTTYFLQQEAWYNELVLGHLLPQHLRMKIPHVPQTWLRNYVGSLFIYFLTSCLWCLYIYLWKRHVYFPQGDKMPTAKSIQLQISVSLKAMPLYACLPTFTEYVVARGWTRCYASIDDVGLFHYLVFTLVYLVLVEFGIYWVHRILHECKPLYKWIHATHHIYNKESTLSPFAGFALNPLDGILQGCPHTIFLFLVPTHFTTHIVLFFIEGIWTTNIHDALHGNVWPILGAGYHTIHHLTYSHNYGHYTIWMDQIFGTLLTPNQHIKYKSR